MILFRLRQLQEILLESGILTATNVLLNAAQKRISSRLGFQLYSHKYSQNVIFMASMAKSGSSWVASILYSLPGFQQIQPAMWKKSASSSWNESKKEHDLYPDIFSEYKGKLAVIKGHTWGKPENAEILDNNGIKYIFTIRDPRDALISNYYHARNHHQHWDHDLVNQMKLNEFITYKIQTGAFKREILSWLKMWMDNRNPEFSLIIRYEDMLENDVKEISKAIRFLSFDIDQSTIDEICLNNRFNKVTGRQRGDEDQDSFYRKGISGEWKESFTEKNKTLLEQCEYQELIYELGYE